MGSQIINTSITPFLRWAGGKRWLVSNHSNIFPTEYDRYFEPFLGSGVVFFHLKPSKAILGDRNADLTRTYNAIKNDPAGVGRSLLVLKTSNIDYYEVRSWLPRNENERAARFIYLNRTCWNGLWRVNLKGEFNVPKGSKDIKDYPEDDFNDISNTLENTEIINEDFETLIDRSSNNDFVFADPPYTVRHNKNGFIKYNESIFSWQDQERLAECLLKAVKRGVKVLCTNANHESVRNLYSKRFFKVQVVSRYSSISSKSTSRKSFEELIIKSK